MNLQIVDFALHARAADYYNTIYEYQVVDTVILPQTPALCDCHVIGGRDAELDRIGCSEGTGAEAKFRPGFLPSSPIPASCRTVMVM